MSKYTIGDAIRMVGHLLEHNGITGPFFADKKGRSTEANDSATCRYCAAGACKAVAETLGVDHVAVRDTAATVWGQRSIVLAWELKHQSINVPSSAGQRKKLARKLQAYNG